MINPHKTKVYTTITQCWQPTEPRGRTIESLQPQDIRETIQVKQPVLSSPTQRLLSLKGHLVLHNQTQTKHRTRTHSGRSQKQQNLTRGYKTWVRSKTQNKVQWLAACGLVSTSSQSLRFILSLRLYSSLVTSVPCCIRTESSPSHWVFKDIMSSVAPVQAVVTISYS